MSVSFAELRQATPSAFARRALWYLLSVGGVWRDEIERHHGADKTGLHLFWVSRGAGWLETPRGRAELCPGPRCWLVDLGQPRAYVPSAGRLVTQSFRFNGSLLHVWLDLIGGAGEVALDRDAAARLRATYGTLLRLASAPSRQDEWQIHGALTRVWGEIFAARGIFRQDALPPVEPVRRVLDAVLSRPAHDWQARHLAKIAGVSYSGLRELFRKTRGETLHDFVQKVRIGQAHTLLADPLLSIKQIVARLGFRGESHFTHWLRRHTGQTPTGYREAQRG